MAQVKILIVGESGSIHTNRFTSLLQEIGYDVRLFQCEYLCWMEEHLVNTVVYVVAPTFTAINGNTIVYFSCRLYLGQLLWFIYRFWNLLFKRWKIDFSKRSRPDDLARVIRCWKPDIVFSLKMQNDGYTVSATRDMMGDTFTPPWVHFNWGTDIEFFGKHPDYSAEHLPKIKKLLARCDYHISDCKRDVRQAADLGFSGESLGVCLANGGFDLDFLQKIRRESAAKRDVILIKGREGAFVGKAFNVLAALHRIPQLLKNYQVKILMPTDAVRGAAKFLTKLDGIDYELLPYLPYTELLAIYARCRIAISASDVDGTPSFLVEAMAMGAFPVHSDMESVREWISDGINGLLFPVDDIQAIASCIEKALQDDDLVESARFLNWDIAVARMDRNKISAHLKSLIEKKILK